MDSTNNWYDHKSLDELAQSEWESLCDGCGKCCLFKLEDILTGQVTYTNASCKLLDVATGRCTYYEDRVSYIPNCITLTPEIVRAVRWLPSTCAYRLRAEGKPLPDWHPLKTGNPDSPRQDGAGVEAFLRRAGEAWAEHQKKKEKILDIAI